MIAFYSSGLEPLQAEYESHAIDEHGYLRRLREPKRFVHYYYPLDDLREEVYKRTSMIGKHTTNDDGSNRLDSIAFSQDEDEQFEYIVNDGAHEIFEKIIAYTDDRVRSFIYNDGADNTMKRAESLGNTIRNAKLTKTDDIAGGSFTYTYTFNTDKVLGNGEQIVLVFRGAYKVRNFMGRTELRTFEQTAVVTGAATSHKISKTYTPEIDTTIGRMGIQAEQYKGIDTFELVSQTINYANPATVPANTWVEYTKLDGTQRLYYAIAPSDMNADIDDTSLYIDMTGYDLRYSIHYVVNKPQWVRENSMVMTDKSIFEALVSYVLYKWFLIVLPQQAEFYANEFARRLSDIKFRLGFCERMSVVSHPF